MTRPNAIAKPRSARPLVAGLLLLSAVPIAAGLVRLAQLAGGVAITPDNARFVTAPLPVTIHIVAIGFYALLGALQFVPALRTRGASCHRIAGRLTLIAAFATALSGIWMTLFYPLPDVDRGALDIMRLAVGLWMASCLALGLAAIRRRDIGTQVFTHLPYNILAGKPDTLARAILMGAGWGINIVIAEWIIHKQDFRPARRPARKAMRP